MATIDVERRGAVAVVTLSNPSRRNALTLEMRQAVLEAFRAFAGDEDVRAVVVAGDGDAFCAGADVGAMGGRDLAGARARMKTMHAMIRAVHGLDKPVVAAVQGLAIGIGCTMLMHADIIYAAPEARFRLPFVDLGVVPELGSSLLLPWLAGHHRASELMLLGEFFDAATAREIGLVNRLVPLPELLPNATATAAALARKPAEALRLTKSLLRRDRPALLARMEEERVLFARQLASPETQAIMAGVLKPKA